jgi:O-antigen ligase
LLAVFLARAPLAAGVALLAGSGLALVILAQPAVGLVALAAAIPVGGLLPLPIQPANAVDVLVACVVAGWLARGIAGRKLFFRRPPLLWPMAILIGCGALSLLRAASWAEGIPELLKWLELAAVFVVAAHTLKGRPLWWAVAALIGAGLIQVALGAWQFLRQVGPEAFILAGRFMRAYGTFRQPNPYAGYLGYILPVAAGLALAGWGFWRRRGRGRDLLIGATCGAVSLALALGIVLSWSRGSWIALVAALGAVVWLRERRPVRAAALAGLVLAALLLVGAAGWLPPELSGRLSGLGGYLVAPNPARTEITDENFAVLERLAHWQAGVRMFEEHPWTGVGIGNYGAAYERHAPAHWYDALGHAHNVFLNFMAEMGLLGLAAFLLFWLAAFRLTARSTRRHDGYEAALAAGVFGTLTYLTVHGLFDYLFVQHMQLQLALLLGSISALEMREAAF